MESGVLHFWEISVLFVCLFFFNRITYFFSFQISYELFARHTVCKIFYILSVISSGYFFFLLCGSFLVECLQVFSLIFSLMFIVSVSYLNLFIFDWFLLFSFPSTIYYEIALDPVYVFSNFVSAQLAEAE